MIEELFLDLYLIGVYECPKNSNIRIGSGNDRVGQVSTIRDPKLFGNSGFDIRFGTKFF